MSKTPEMKMRLTAPPLRPGKVFAAVIYPGGRRELMRQVDPDALEDPVEAVERLLTGHRVTVDMDAFFPVWSAWKKREGAKT